MEYKYEPKIMNDEEIFEYGCWKDFYCKFSPMTEEEQRLLYWCILDCIDELEDKIIENNSLLRKLQKVKNTKLKRKELKESNIGILEQLETYKFMMIFFSKGNGVWDTKAFTLNNVKKSRDAYENDIKKRSC